MVPPSVCHKIQIHLGRAAAASNPRAAAHNGYLEGQVRVISIHHTAEISTGWYAK